MVGVLRLFLLSIQRRAFTPEGENWFWPPSIFYVVRIPYWAFPQPTYKDGFRRCCLTLASTYFATERLTYGQY